MLHSVATVSDVVVANGSIQSVQTDQGEFSADIFIDCTGFRGLLLDALKTDNWQSFTDALPCNKAVAIQRELPAESQSPTLLQRR